MTTATETTTATTQIHRVYIRATPEAIWEAITSPEWSDRYGYGGRVQYDLRPGGAYIAYTGAAMKRSGLERGHTVPDVACDGEVLEADPPRRLVQTFRMLMDDAMKAEGFTRLTYEIDQMPGGVCRLTLVHDLETAPRLALIVGGGLEAQGAGGGWAWVLSGLKTLLETGEPLNAS